MINTPMRDVLARLRLHVAPSNDELRRKHWRIMQRIMFCHEKHFQPRPLNDQRAEVEQEMSRRQMPIPNWPSLRQ